MSLLYPLAKRFVAGESRDALVRRMALLTERGLCTTVAFVGEHVRARTDADATVREYLELLHALHQHGFECDISVKLTQLGLEIDHELAQAHLQRIATAAHAVGGRVEVDMEESVHVAATVAIVTAVHQAVPVVRAVVQAMLRRTPNDVTALCAAQIPVRLVKGAYKETANVAYQTTPEIRHQFSQLMEQLFETGVHPAIGTHDEQLIAQAQVLARRYGKTARDFEFQMLLGIRSSRQEALHHAGWSVRIYTPYGRAWRPYFSRRLRERKENLWFVMRHLFR